MACAQATNELIPKKHIAYQAVEKIIIDGDESDAEWRKVKWSEPFIDIQGKKTPQYSTQIKMLWDSTYFYILAEIEEPHVWGNIKKRDAIIFHNNDFEVFVDPDGDTHNYYELEFNALNTIWDLFLTKPYREGNIVLNDWTATGLKSAVKVNGTLNNSEDIDKGWTIEIAIPWSVFKKSYYENNVPVDNFWRINFSRVNWEFQLNNGIYERKKDSNEKLKHEYNWVWSPTGVINMHEPEKWGYVYFSSVKAGDIDNFLIPKDEKIKWELYKLHRAQKAYFKKHNSFASSLDSITSSTTIIENKNISFVLENYNFGYSIRVKSPFSNKLLRITEDGKFMYDY